MTTTHRAYVEHVAIRVADIYWHIRFFRDVLGMTIRETTPEGQAPYQVWTIGGMQLMSVPGFKAPPSNDAGWLAHLGIMVENLEAALDAARAWEVRELPQGRNWLQLPDGLAIELIQANGNAVAEALALKPRA
ncbi:VOC family protein [Aromatoleum toluvorans]|uniref:VOC family protein n=1 Tax=Aromatoleum toluvorans TaxID=92002 RepID=A0ABX1PRX4_9RHOO|nr:VOC family protein [Aromatoleum toluvorans]NMG42198.1 VOC family protein [Aromatoleum toluvorans]